MLNIVRDRDEAYYSRYSVARVVLFRQVVILFVRLAEIVLVGRLIVFEESCFFEQANLDCWKRSVEKIRRVPQLPWIDLLCGKLVDGVLCDYRLLWCSSLRHILLLSIF